MLLYAVEVLHRLLRVISYNPLTIIALTFPHVFLHPVAVYHLVLQPLLILHHCRSFLVLIACLATSEVVRQLPCSGT